MALVTQRCVLCPIHPGPQRPTEATHGGQAPSLHVTHACMFVPREIPRAEPHGHIPRSAGATVSYTFSASQCQSTCFASQASARRFSGQGAPQHLPFKR